MSETVQVKRKVFGKNTFSNVVNTQFTQLIPAATNTVVEKPVTVADFFQSYTDLFYSIPPSGSDNSHETLVNNSSEYLGISYQDLIKELTEVRNENVALRNQLFTLTQQS